MRFQKLAGIFALTLALVAQVLAAQYSLTTTPQTFAATPGQIIGVEIVSGTNCEIIIEASADGTNWRQLDRKTGYGTGYQYDVSAGMYSSLRVRLSGLNGTATSATVNIVPFSRAGVAPASYSATRATVQSLVRLGTISAPVTWISARQAYSDSGRATLATDGGTVQTARDLAGRGFNAAQATALARPTYRATGILSLFPGLEFNASTASLPISGLMAASDFSAGHTVYVALANNTVSSISVAGGYTSNGTYAGAIDADTWRINPENAGTWQVDLDSAPADMSSGVLCWSYSGTNLTFGWNGRHKATIPGRTAITSGNFIIGNLSDGGGFQFPARFGEVIVFAGMHSEATRNLISASLARDYPGLIKPSVIFEGDSITSGFGLASSTTQSYPVQTVAAAGMVSSYLYQNFGVPGNTAAQLLTRAQANPENYSHYASSGRGARNIVVIFAGTNDLSASGDNVTAAVAQTRLQALIDHYAATGSKIVVGTILPRDAGNAGAGFEAKRITLNAAIRAGLPNVAAVADFGADARFALGSAYYQADNIHPSEQGCALMAQIATGAIESLRYNP